MTDTYQPRLRPDLLEAITEKQFQGQVTGLCKYFDLAFYHPFDSRRSNPGFPDLVIVGRGVVYAELKTMKGRLSPHQRTWIARLRDAGQEVHVWRPDDLDDIHTRLHALAGRPRTRRTTAALPTQKDA